MVLYAATSQPCHIW